MEEQVLKENTNELIKIEKPRAHYQGVLFSVSILIFIFSIWMIYLWATIINYPIYPLMFICGVLPLLLSISFFRTCLRWGTLMIYDDRLEMHSILKLKIRKIYFRDIVRSDEYERYIKYKGGDNHLIFTLFSNDSTSISVRSDFYSSFYILKILFKKEQEKTIENRPTRFRFILWGFNLLLGISLLLTSFYNFQTKQNIHPSELIELKGIIANHLQITESSYIKSVFIKLDMYPDNSFLLETPLVSIITNNNLLQDIKSGDSITIKVDKNEYHQKIVKDIPLSFSEKLNYNSPLQIYTIQTRDKSYLSLNEYNDSVISYKTKMMYLWLVIGVIIIYINLKKKPKNVLVENKDYTPPYEHGKIRRRQASFLDIPAIKKLFRESITHINNQDYTPEQISAWIKRGENDDMWRSRIINQYFIVVACDSELFGFASITYEGHIDFMFVHHLYQHRGFGSLLFESLENFAYYFSLNTLTVDASITAKPFFQKKGFYVLKEQQVDIGEILTNYRMVRQLQVNQFLLRATPSPVPQHNAHHPLPPKQFLRHNRLLLHKEKDL